MLRSPGWSRALGAVLLVMAMGVWLSPSDPAYGQVVRGPVPAGGALGPGPIVPWHPDPGPLGPGPLGPGPFGPGPIISAPAGNPLSAPPIDSRRAAAETRAQPASAKGTSVASAVTAISRSRGGKAQRAAERERMRVASAVKTIGQQNRQSAAIVLKIRRVTP